MDNEIEMENRLSVIEKMRARAVRARTFANASVGIIVAVVFAMILFFYVTPSNIKISAFEASSITVEQSVLSDIAPSIAKIASIFLAVYLIQILVGFTRYQYRVADHLDAAAFAIELCDSDVAKLEGTMSVISVSHIEFGKMPASISDKGLEVVKDAISKIPTK